MKLNARLSLRYSDFRAPRGVAAELEMIKRNGVLVYGYAKYADMLDYYARNLPVHENKPVFVSYHTSDKRYKAHANLLLMGLNALGLDYFVADIGEPDKVWVHNVQWKARQLLAARKAHPGRPLVWIDIDAEVLRYPYFLSGLECDYAIVRTDRYRDWGNLIYFQDTPAANLILSLWAEYNEAHPQVWDETILTWAWHTAYCRLPCVSTMFIPPNGPIVYGRGARGIIRQYNASNGRHDMNYEVTARRFSTKFRHAVMNYNFTREFTFADVYDNHAKPWRNI